MTSIRRVQKKCKKILDNCYRIRQTKPKVRIKRTQYRKGYLKNNKDRKEQF